jgi:transcriptional antiterminator RfaH
MKYWIAATYKIKEINILERNLSNQNFQYYLPKITTKKINTNPKDEVLFPGYIFIKTKLDKFSSVKFTKGLKNIIKFGYSIPYISENEIKFMQLTEKASKIDPVVSQIQIGQEVSVSGGSFKGNIVKISSFPSKERVTILLSFLGSIRRANIPIKDLTL